MADDASSKVSDLYAYRNTKKELDKVTTAAVQGSHPAGLQARRTLSRRQPCDECPRRTRSLLTSPRASRRFDAGRSESREPIGYWDTLNFWDQSGHAGLIQEPPPPSGQPGLELGSSDRSTDQNDFTILTHRAGDIDPFGELGDQTIDRGVVHNCDLAIEHDIVIELGVVVVEDLEEVPGLKQACQPGHLGRARTHFVPA
ncbi:hypothetical protein E8D34_10060 [Nocardioides sp. GY 10113]|uniref:hypothetical protein n=1 Tax=Nocardioides sp. GY 10113 TaxID=2569761 RepID=UPI0010A7A17F|nr:hypothetical protein [Nocardioides sp. GY 10113]TIC87460.1 hypothetical protein E8D34_10060 [Nocardioides sp. GY 10113]